MNDAGVNQSGPAALAATYRHLPNAVSLARFPLLGVVVALLYLATPLARALVIPLLILLIFSDFLDGYLARRLQQSSLLGSVLDIAGDRAVEQVLWIALADLQLISVLVPLIIIPRGILTDAVRGVAVRQGVTPFGMMRSTVGRFLVQAPLMRTGNNVVKSGAFIGLTLAYALQGYGLRFAELHSLAQALALRLVQPGARPARHHRRVRLSHPVGPRPRSRGGGMTHFQFRIASEPHEFEQIHRLNYRTFVQEIPQHAPNNRQRLVDKFHDQNNYVICLHMEKVLGMVAVRAERPFSLDAKLQNLDAYLPAHDRLCEIRLLAVEPQYRRGPVFAGLLEKGARYGLSQGYDLAVISGTVRQLKLYKHLGFVPFGPLVGTPDALYQPMYWTLAAFEQNLGWLKALLAENDGADLG